MAVVIILILLQRLFSKDIRIRKTIASKKFLYYGMMDTGIFVLQNDFNKTLTFV